MSVRQCCRSVRVIFFCRRSSVHCTGCEWRNRDVDNTQPSMYATDSGRKEAGDQDALTSTTSLTGAASSKASLHGHLFLSVSMRRRSRCTDHRRRRFLAGKSIISRRGRRASLQAGYYYPAGSVGFVYAERRALWRPMSREIITRGRDETSRRRRRLCEKCEGFADGALNKDVDDERRQEFHTSRRRRRKRQTGVCDHVRSSDLSLCWCGSVMGGPSPDVQSTSAAPPSSRWPNDP